MRVPEGRVGDGHRSGLPERTGETLRAAVPQHRTPGDDVAALVPADVRQLRPRRHGDPRLTVGTVHGDVGEPAQQLRAAVAALRALQQVRPLVDEGRRDAAGEEVGLGEHGLQERDVGAHAADPELRQGAPGPPHRRREICAAGDQLHEHGVEVRADGRAGVRRAAVQPDPGPARRPVGVDDPGVRPESVRRVLGGDAALQCRAVQLDLVLGEAEVCQALPRRDPQLRLDEVDVGDLLGDRVLDLDARVHLDEHVPAGVLPRRVEQELDRARVDVAHLPGERHSVPAQGLPDAPVQSRSRGDLDDLLVPALDGAVPLEEVHGRRRRRPPGPAPRCGGDAGRPARGTASRRRTHLRPRASPSRALPAVRPGPRPAASRVPRRRRRPWRTPGSRSRAAAATSSSTSADGAEERSTGTPAARAASTARTLFPAIASTRGGGPTKVMPGRLARTGQAGVLGQEAVARVDGVRSGLARDPDDLGDVQVGPHRVAALADQVRLVGLGAVHRVAVFPGEDGDGADAELVGGTEGPDGDLPAVGDEQRGEHGAHGSERPRTPPPGPFPGRVGPNGAM